MYTNLCGLARTHNLAECVEHASAEVASSMPPGSSGLAQVAPLKRKPEAHRLQAVGSSPILLWLKGTARKLAVFFCFWTD